MSKFIRGRKDGIKRAVTEVKLPSIPKNRFGVNKIIPPSDKPGYIVAQIEVKPGEFAIQLVDASRIEHEKAA